MFAAEAMLLLPAAVRHRVPDGQICCWSSGIAEEGAKFEFTPAMEVAVREIIAELAAPPIVVFPDWDAVADGSRSFRVYCDACIDAFGAALEQEQPDGSVRPIAYISRATLDSERHWTPLNLEAGSIVWALKRLPQPPTNSQRPVGRAACLLNDEPVRRAAADAPLGHAGLPFDSFLPPRHHAHSADARTFLLVDRYDHLHPVVASPLPEVPRTENLAADGPLAHHPHAPVRLGIAVSVQHVRGHCRRICSLGYR